MEGFNVKETIEVLENVSDKVPVWVFDRSTQKSYKVVSIDDDAFVHTDDSGAAPCVQFEFRSVEPVQKLQGSGMPQGIGTGLAFQVIVEDRHGARIELETIDSLNDLDSLIKDPMGEGETLILNVVPRPPKMVEMTDTELQNMLEALADIAYDCGRRNFRIPDSRANMQLMIDWAKDFHYLHRGRDWSDGMYIEMIEQYTADKITGYDGEVIKDE